VVQTGGSLVACFDLIKNASKAREGDAPMSPHENYLIELWSKHLNVPQIGVNDDFFTAGGSSMQVIEMLMAVSSELGAEIDFDEFFKEPCIRKLSELISA
jgi:acyl carrier protein